MWHSMKFVSPKMETMKLNIIYGFSGFKKELSKPKTDSLLKNFESSQIKVVAKDYLEEAI